MGGPLLTAFIRVGSICRAAFTEHRTLLCRPRREWRMQPFVGCCFCMTQVSYSAVMENLTVGQACGNAICRTKGKAMIIEESWQEFFADPSQWWDIRAKKRNRKSPDFVHSETKEALWIDNCLNPPWVEAEVTALKEVEVHGGRPVRAAYLWDSLKKCGGPRVNRVRVIGHDGSVGVFSVLRDLCGEGRLLEALQVVDHLKPPGECVSMHIFCFLLQGCIKKKDVAIGREVHSLIVRNRLESNTFLGSYLIRMFALCGNLFEADLVFSKLLDPNVFAWSEIISAQVRCGEDNHAIDLYNKMLHSLAQPDGHVYVAVLRACASAEALFQGRWIHSHIIENGYDSDVYISNTLIDMYVKHESLDDAHLVFDNLTDRDVVTWGAIIAGYTHHGLVQEALQLFHEMQQDGVEPNNVTWNALISGYAQHGPYYEALCLFDKMQECGKKPDGVTYVSILQACSRIIALDVGKLIHANIIENGLGPDAFIRSTLIDMYAKCGSLEDACRVFDRMPEQNVVTWNAMIAGYVEHGHDHKAWLFLLKMQEKGMEPNQVTSACILRTCFRIADLHAGKLIHSYIIENGFGSDLFAGNALINMYANCESLKDAHWVFERLPNRDIVTWNAMISGCTIHGYGQEALLHFQQMLWDGMEPNQATFVCTMKACLSIVSLQQGKLIHNYIIHYGFEFDVIIGNTLIDMYAKCGSLEDAHILFGKLSKQDAMTWGTMMAGCAQHSHYKLALQYFEDMQRRGLEPNEVIFGSVLSACCHLGLVDEGYRHFKSMSERYGVPPTLDHYNYMVDLLGRAGCLNEAEDLLQSIPFGPNIVGWMSLLSHCQNHGNLKLGQRCFDCLLTVDLKKAGGYMLMSNIYVRAGIQEEAYKVEEMRKGANAWKEPGKVTIEVGNKVHHFVVGGTRHPQSDDIYAKLNYLSVQMKEVGYMPCVDVVLQSMPDEDKENVLSGHCESGHNEDGLKLESLL